MALSKGAIIMRDGVAFIRWRRAGHKPVQRMVGTKTNAERVQALVYARRLGGEPFKKAVARVMRDPEPEAEVTTMSDLVDGRIRVLEKTRAPHNLRRELCRIELFRSHFGDMDPAKIDAAVVAKWADGLGRKLTGKSVNRNLALGSKIWRWGQQHRLAPLDFNPFQLIDRETETPAEKVSFTQPELAALLSHLPDDIADYGMTTVQSCWRPIELENLPWSALSDGILTCPPKPGSKSPKGKSLALTGSLNATLEARRGLPRALIFTRGGSPWRPRSRGLRFRKALDLAIADGEVPEHKSGASWYSLKGSGLTILLANGESPAIISKMSGVSISTIMAHYMGDVVEAQREALRRVWGD